MMFRRQQLRERFEISGDLFRDCMVCLLRVLVDCKGGSDLAWIGFVLLHALRYRPDEHGDEEARREGSLDPAARIPASDTGYGLPSTAREANSPGRPSAAGTSASGSAAASSPAACSSAVELACESENFHHDALHFLIFYAVGHGGLVDVMRSVALTNLSLIPLCTKIDSLVDLFPVDGITGVVSFSRVLSGDM